MPCFHRETARSKQGPLIVKSLPTRMRSSRSCKLLHAGGGGRSSVTMVTVVQVTYHMASEDDDEQLSQVHICKFTTIVRPAASS